jgi:nucleolar GTP-binding protein
MVRDFKRLPTILRADELTKFAFKRASKEGKAVPKKHQPKYIWAKRAEGKRVMAASGAITYKLKRITNILRLDDLTPFYTELIDATVGIEKIKKATGVLSWASSTIEKYEKTYRYKIRMAKKEEDIYRLRKEFYGKVASVLKKIDDQFTFLAKAREELKNLPSFEDTFTVVIAGPPNVGKSTFLQAMTGAAPKVDVYPFTTKQILVGHFERNHQRYQAVDTPGLLDRRLDDRNPIERQAIMALEHLANVILFIFDPSETCGFPMPEQTNIYNDIKGAFGVPIIPVLNKTDLKKPDVKTKKISNHVCAAVDGTGIDGVIDEILSLESS